MQFSMERGQVVAASAGRGLKVHRVRRRAVMWWGMALLSLTGLNATAQVAAGGSGPDTVFAEAGKVNRTRTVSIGASWDWERTWVLGSGRLSARNDAWLSQWRYADETHGYDRTTLWQIAFVPVVRYRAASGASPWFAEAGIGASLSSKLYATDTRRFSTALNFADHLAIGRNFGERGQHELAIRVEHYSNGGVKEPNTGVTLIALRYSHALN